MDVISDSKHGRGRRALAALALTSIITLAGCGSGTAATTSGDEASSTSTIKYGFAPIAALGSVVAAEDEGIFANHGLSVEWQTLASTPESIAAVVGGDLDISSVNPVNLVQALDQNIPIVILGTHYYSSEADQGFFVAPDSTIKGPEDWAGKRFGVIGLNNISHLAAMDMADKAGVDAASIDFVQVPAPNMIEMLRQGQIDVVGLSEPFITIGGGDIRRLDSVGDPYTIGGGEDGVLAYYFTSKEFAENNPEVIEAFGDARDDTVKLLADNPQYFRSAIAEFTEIQPDVLDRMSLPALRADEGRATFEYWAEVANKFGLVEGIPDTDATFEYSFGNN